MNIDFVIYTPPKVNYDLITLWGEVVYVPRKNRDAHSKDHNVELFNCYRAKREADVNLSLEAARMETYGVLIQDILQSQVTQASQQFESSGQLIPCLFLNSMVKSKFLLIYFHSSGEDIKLAKGFLDHLRNLYQANVLAVEYPGYSVYKGSPNSERIRQDAESVYDYVTKVVGFVPQNIIVIGRSIGAATKAVDLATKRVIGALVLISPFASLKTIAKELLGSWATYLVKEQHNNLEKMENVKYPLFLLHGKADKLISYENSIMLAKKYKGKMKVKLPKEMSHSSFNYYEDFSDPLREFLLELGINFYSQCGSGPEMPAHLFRNPLDMLAEKRVK